MLATWQFLISALLLGAALWLSRAVGDVSSAGVRVAYLRSAPELLGLAVFGWLVLTLMQAGVERGIGRTRPGAHLSSDAVIPLVALTLLALPYLPWLPDRVPLVFARNQSCNSPFHPLISWSVSAVIPLERAMAESLATLPHLPEAIRVYA